MAYIAHEWTDGETLTAEKMNALESGIEEVNNGILILGIDPELSELYLNITVNDIINAFRNGIKVILKSDNYFELLQVSYSSNNNGTYTFLFGSYMLISTQSAPDEKIIGYYDR